MQTGTRSRGFASMDAEKQREIARKGGKAAHAKGTAHEFTADEARAAGRKGGERVSSNREHMSRIGRIGGKSSASRRAPTDNGNGNGDGSAGSTTGHASPEQRSASHPGNGEGQRGEEVRGASGGAGESPDRSADAESA